MSKKKQKPSETLQGLRLLLGLLLLLLLLMLRLLLVILFCALDSPFRSVPADARISNTLANTKFVFRRNLITNIFTISRYAAEFRATHRIVHKFCVLVGFTCVIYSHSISLIENEEKRRSAKQSANRNDRFGRQEKYRGTNVIHVPFTKLT